MMPRVKHLFAALLLGVNLSGTVAANEKQVVLASLEWPPYTSNNLPEQGASVAVAKAAFKAMGYDLKVEFYPWSRAVDLGKKDAKFAGYFPEYYSDDVAKEFTLSEPMGSGPLGFAERSDAVVSWSKLADLSSKKIGVVQDYVNTSEFDARVAARQQSVDVAPDDGKNLLKLANKRIDLAVVDKNVLNYLLKTDNQLKSFQGKLQINAKLLEDKKLYVCFKKNADGQKIAKIYNEGLKKIDINSIMAKYLK